MRMVEILVSIAIFLLLIITTLECFTLFNSSSKSLEMRINDSETILEKDYMFRELIHNAKIPYWKNKEVYCDNIIEEIKKLDRNKDVSVLDVKKETEGNVIKGLIVIWKYKDIEIETKESF